MAEKEANDNFGESRCPPYTSKNTVIFDGKERPIAVCVNEAAANFFCAAVNQFCIKLKV